MLITKKEDLIPYYPEKRIWQGIPSIEVTKNGRVFLTYYSGGTKEEFGNYCILASSKDGEGSRYIQHTDSYYAFKKQLDKFVEWLRTGQEPFPFAETVELMKLVIAGIRSREEDGREVFLSEIQV